MTDIFIHYDGTDIDSIVTALAGEWPRICSKAMDDISRWSVAPPQRIVVFVRPDCGLLFFTLESNCELFRPFASVTIQLIEDAYMNCDDDLSWCHRQLRDIARRSLKHPTAVSRLSEFRLPIAIDDYQSLDSATFEMLSE